MDINKQLTIDDISENELYLPKAFISDTFPKTNVSSESRCMPFRPVGGGLKTCQSSERLNISGFSSQKGVSIDAERVPKKRYLIPKPDNRATAEFQPSQNL